MLEKKEKPVVVWEGGPIFFSFLSSRLLTVSLRFLFLLLLLHPSSVASSSNFSCSFFVSLFSGKSERRADFLYSPASLMFLCVPGSNYAKAHLFKKSKSILNSWGNKRFVLAPLPFPHLLTPILFLTRHPEIDLCLLPLPPPNPAYYVADLESQDDRKLHSLRISNYCRGKKYTAVLLCIHLFRL